MIRRLVLFTLMISLMVSLKAIEIPKAGFTAADVTTSGDVVLRWKILKMLVDTRNVIVYHSIGNGPFQKLSNGIDLASLMYTHTGGAADNLVHKYVMVVPNNSLDTIVSDTVSTIISTAVSINDARIGVSWNSALVRPGYIWNGYYQVYVTDPGGSAVFIDSTSSLSYEWTADHCIEGVRMSIKWSVSGDTSNTVSTGPLVDLFDPVSPVVDSVSVQDNGINIIGWEKSTAPDIGGYIVLAYRAGVWDTLSVLNSPDSLRYIDSTANSSMSNWTYAVSALDWCGNASGDLGIPRKLSTIFLEKPDYIKCEDNLSLSWSAYTNSSDSLIGYEILLNESGTGWYIADTVPPDSLQCKIKGLNDRKLYSIKVRALGFEGSFSSSSNQRTVYIVKPVRPKYVLIRTASVLENQLAQLFIEADTTINITGYQIWRSSDGKPEVLAGVISDPGRQLFYWTDSLARPATRVYSYRVASLDSCGNPGTWSQNFETVKVNLVNQTLGEIDWNKPDGFDVIQYDVLRKSDSSWQLLSTVSSETYNDVDMPILSVEQDLYYRIRIIGHPYDSIELTDTAYSSILHIIPKFRMWVPNAFRPGGGFNDQFKPKAWAVKPHSYTMFIYSRFGQLIWQTEDLEVGWDGTINGEDVPGGVYAWVIRLTTNKGRIEEQSGSVVLLRSENN